MLDDEWKDRDVRWRDGHRCSVLTQITVLPFLGIGLTN
jgi:hypothetical protein